MNRTLFSALLLSATALLLLAPAQQASAYDGHYDYPVIEPPCRDVDYYYLPNFHIPPARYGCGLRGGHEYLPQYNRFRIRGHFVRGYDSAAPAPRRGGEFHRPESQRPAQGNQRNNQFDPFERYAPDRNRSGITNSPAGLPRMELPPPQPGNSKKETPPASHSHSHSHDHGDSKSVKPSTKPHLDHETENNNPSMQPPLPRISPPDAQLSIPSGS